MVKIRLFEDPTELDYKRIRRTHLFYVLLSVISITASVFFYIVWEDYHWALLLLIAWAIYHECAQIYEFAELRKKLKELEEVDSDE